MFYNRQNNKIFVTGHNGLVGSSIVNCLKHYGYEHYNKDKSELNLLDQKSTKLFFKNEKPDNVIVLQQKLEVFMQIKYIRGSFN